MPSRTGVGWYISASHPDRLTGAIHGHSWEVIAWHECQHDNDAVALQNHLKGICEAFDHTILPADLSTAEGLADAILRMSPPSCVEVQISRPIERLYAKAFR